MAGRAFLVFIVLIQACGLSESNPLAWRLEGGGRLGDLIPASRPVVVLIVDPGQCFSCYSLLAEWFAWRDDHLDQFLFLYSRHPTDVESRTLRRIRVPVAGTLTTKLAISAALEVLVANDSVYVINHIKAGQDRSSLLLLIGDRTLEGIIRSPEPKMFSP